MKRRPRKEASDYFRCGEILEGKKYGLIPTDINSLIKKHTLRLLSEAFTEDRLMGHGQWMNIRLIRYADVVLMHAGCLNGGHFR